MSESSKIAHWIKELIPDDLSSDQLRQLIQLTRNISFDTQLAYQSASESIQALCHALEMELDLIQDKLTRHEEIVLNARFMIERYVAGDHLDDFDLNKLSAAQKHFLATVDKKILHH